MNVLIVGYSGREHAMIRAMEKSRIAPMLYSAPGNGGVSEHAVCIDTKATDVRGIVRAAIDHSVDLAVVSPDDPLMIGIVDELEQHGIRTFGPKRNAAIIEGSRIFAKRLMKKYSIPTADYCFYESFDDARADISSRDAFPVMIKADSRKFGRAADREEAMLVLREMEKDKFPGSPARILIEEHIEGREFSFFAFTDGETVAPMPAVKVYRYEGDSVLGMSSKGMGSVCPAPFFTEQLEKECVEKIIRPTVDAMNAEGRHFRGVIGFRGIDTEKGVRVLEYSSRFTDPEAQALLPLLESDIIDVINAVLDGDLAHTEIRWAKKSCACVIAMSGGYPGHYEKGFEIHGLDDITEDQYLRVFHSCSRYTHDGRLVTSGGRVLSVSAVADTLPEAAEKAYAGIGKISFDGMQYR